MNLFKKLLKLVTFQGTGGDETPPPAPIEKIEDLLKPKSRKRRRSMLSEEEGGFQQQAPTYISSLLSKD